MGGPRIGILFGGTQFLIDRQFWAGATEAAEARGASLSAICGGMLDDPRLFARFDNLLFDLTPHDAFDAIVAWTGEMAVYAPRSRIEALLGRFRGIPVVCAASEVPGYPCVIGDNYGGMRRAVEHLIEGHGKRRLAFIHGPIGHPEADKRFDAYRDALAAAGISVDQRLCLPGDFDEASGRRAIRELAARGPIDADAVIAANDPSALGAMKELQSMGFDVPDDVAVVGFDDREDAACSKPGLSTVRYSFHELGRLSVENAIHLASGANVPPIIRVDAPFVPRRSCGCHKPPRDDDASWYKAIARMRGDNAGDAPLIEPDSDDDDSGRVFHEALLRFEEEHDEVARIMAQAVVELELGGLADALAKYLPHLGISRFDLWLMGKHPRDPDSRMTLVARDEGGDETRPAIGARLTPRLAFGTSGASRRVESLAVPLCFRDELLAILVAELPAKSVRVLETLKGPLARGIKSSLLLEERERAKNELDRAYARVSLINELGTRMTSLLDVGKLLKSASELIRDEFGVPAVVVWLRDEDGAEERASEDPGEARARLSLSPAFAAFGDEARGASIDGLARAEPGSAPLLAAGGDGSAKRFGPESKEGDSSYFRFAKSRLCVPLEVSGRIVGALDLQSDREGFFGPEAVSVIVALARFVASAIRNASLYAFATRARAEAEEANRMKSRFLSTVSHELRTPLNAVINFAFLLGVGSEGELTPGQKELIEAIESSGRLLLKLINDILDLAKIEAGKMELFLEKVDLRLLAGEAFEVAQGLVEGKGVALTRELADELPDVTADRTRVLQIVLNLLSNAAKFTERGEIRLRVGAVGRFVELSVSDTGPGMEPDELTRVFQEFAQLKSGAKKAGSTGLGLPIARKLAEAHGGSLDAASTPGQGSVFTLRLPIDGPDGGADSSCGEGRKAIHSRS
jgi:signal transduction histidine kinase/DNA-binding LacI/PurR family transcriptional regulator